MIVQSNTKLAIYRAVGTVPMIQTITAPDNVTAWADKVVIKSCRHTDCN